MLTKTTLTAIGLVASGVVAAGSMGAVCTPGNVTVPCEAKRWDLGVQALYLHATVSAASAYQPSAFLPAVNGYTYLAYNSYQQPDNDWDWGYRLEGAYHFNTGNDASLTWVHFSGDSDQSGSINAEQPGYGFVPASVPANIAYSMKGKNKLDQVNLILGQHVDLSLASKMRFYGGLQYAEIRFDIKTSFPSLSGTPIAFFRAATVTSLSQLNDTDYRGLGPVVGLDYAYDLTGALSLTANGSGSILYGSSRYSNSYVEAGGVVLKSVYANKKALVPSLEAKLGLNYVINMAQGLLNLQGGYQVMNYFNALQSQGAAGVTGAVTNSDYGLYGPYLGLKYLGNI
ncbi:MAG: Lpg1974 family pore-forming outer membrane protein [Legionellales bacterium]